MEQKKKALGRGLEQLFSSEVLDFDQFESNIMESAEASDIKELPVEEIRPNPYQPRKSFNEEALQELAESIKNYGVFQPIIVKKSIKGYDLIAGERRLRASKIAGRSAIPAIIKDFSDDQMREIALLENLQRENLTPIELAWAYKGIIDSLHIRQEDLADKIGKSRSHVTNTLGLLRLPDEIQNQILDNKISMGHAKILSKIDDDYKVKYQELMEKQYNQMAYVIKDVEENEDTANANVEITVLDYKSSIQESEKYLENNPDKFKDELGNYSEELFTKYKIDQMKLVDSTTTYNLNLKLTKENGMWTVNKLSDEDILKIHGMY